MSRNNIIVNTNNNQNDNDNNINPTNPLSISSSIQRRIGIRRKWESFRRSHQSAENNNRGITTNNSNRENEETFPERNTINNCLELNRGTNANSDNNLPSTVLGQTDLTNTVNNNFNTTTNGTIINSNSTSRLAESPSTQIRGLRRLNYIGRQNRHLLLTIYNNNLIQDNHNERAHIIETHNNRRNNNTVNNNNNLNNNNIDNNNNNTNNNNINSNDIINSNANNINNNNINNNSSNNNTNNNNVNNNNINNNIINNNNNTNNINNNDNMNNNNNNNDLNSNYITSSIINNNNISNNNIMNNSRVNNNRINNNRYNNINQSAKKNEEEEKKKEDMESEPEICKEENIGSEIKDTVKCYICFDKITKPKMCPHCHRIACEKCLYNWFVNLKKTKCGFCRLKSNFQEMISVPFMDAVVTFVEKYFNKRKNLSTTIDKEFLEYCPEHTNELLYYYCLDCGKPYCKTCFVFFGEEKDKHIGHSIIEYEKYKNMSMPLLKKNTDKLEANIQHVEENIKRCLAYKQSYEHERKVGNKFLNNLQIEFNKQINDIISIIDDQIKKLKEYVNEYNKYKKEVEDFYGVIKNKKNNTDKSCESLIIKLTKINQQKFFSSKEIEKLNELSKNMYVHTYQSKIGEFNHENIFLTKGLKMGSSPYELVIDNKQRNEVQISLIIPKERTQINHFYQGLIFLRQKGECIQTYELDEYREDENCFYLKKKIPWDYFGQSIFKIKGILYDFYFE